MPLGVVIESNERCELKSCPPDGYVIIRRMNFGESLKRKDMMASIAMQMNMKGASKEESTRIQMDLLQEKTSLWEFSKLIIEHNITKFVNRNTGQPCKPDDPNGIEIPIDFSKEADIKLLRGQLGDEIQMHINRLNSFEEDENVKNS